MDESFIGRAWKTMFSNWRESLFHCLVIKQSSECTAWQRSNHMTNSFDCLNLPLRDILPGFGWREVMNCFLAWVCWLGDCYHTEKFFKIFRKWPVTLNFWKLSWTNKLFRVWFSKVINSLLGDLPLAGTTITIQYQNFLPKQIFSIKVSAVVRATDDCICKASGFSYRPIVFSN